MLVALPPHCLASGNAVYAALPNWLYSCAIALCAKASLMCDGTRQGHREIACWCAAAAAGCEAAKGP